VLFAIFDEIVTNVSSGVKRLLHLMRLLESTEIVTRIGKRGLLVIRRIGPLTARVSESLYHISAFRAASGGAEETESGDAEEIEIQRRGGRSSEGEEADEEEERDERSEA
jgi:hypothetical protein